MHKVKLFKITVVDEANINQVLNLWNLSIPSVLWNDGQKIMEAFDQEFLEIPQTKIVHNCL